MFPSGQEMGLESTVRAVQLQHTMVVLVKAPRESFVSTLLMSGQGHWSSWDMCDFLQNSRNLLQPRLRQIKP